MVNIYDQAMSPAERDAYYDGSDAMRAEPKIRVVVGSRACELLELLDNRHDYCAAKGIVIDVSGRRVTILAPRSSLLDLVDQWQDRIDNTGGREGYDSDNPSGDKRAARTAVDRVRIALDTDTRHSR